MLHQNEKKAMKSADVKSRVGRSQHTVVLPLRFSFPQYLWIHLVLVLCSGFAVPVSAETSQGNLYFIEVTVESTASETNQQDIIAWLQPMLESNLQTCGTSVNTTTPTISTSTLVTSTGAPASTTPTTSSATPKPDTTTAGTSITDVITSMSDVTTAVTGVSKEKPSNNPNSNSVKFVRLARATTGFLDFELDCVDKTSIVKTTCFVSLTLEENVDPCCILKTLCSANISSSNFSMVWKCAGRGGLLPNQNDTCRNTTEDVCFYTEPTSQTCNAYESRPSTDNLAEANKLLEQTKDASKLTSSEIDKLVSALENLLSGPNVSVALGNTSVKIVSNLQNATLEAVFNSKNRIMRIVDTVGQKLVLRNSTESLLSEAVALSVQKANGANFEETYFSISNPNNVQVGSSGTRAVKQDSSLPQGSVRLPQNLTENLSAEERQMVSRVQFNFYQKSTLFQDKNLGERILNSGIIGASVSNVTISGLQDKVIVSLRNIQPIPANYAASCVFWDFTFNGGSGGWNSKGCSVLNSTDTETICGCNHLTSFGILLDPTRGEITSRVQATILTFITYIGCGISAIFLAVTLLTYLAFGKLRKDIPSKILIQLCLALLLLNLVFLVDAWLALYPAAVGLCISTAWFLHYFLLVAFTWMGLEAVHMYIALVKVFNSYISRYMLKFSLAGWGIPMIVVIIVIAINKDNYGLVSYGKFPDGSTDEFCWIKNDIAFYVAVVAYFCVIFLFNIIMFVVVLVQLCRIKRQNPQNLQHRTTLQDVRSVLGITILLGLTWGFAFFAWGPLNLPFMYLFAIFNSLQGFFIFIFHCAIKENVRRQWRTYLCCGRMRLAENSEWSRTATQKKGNNLTKRVTSHSSKSNNSSSSSYLVSDSFDHMNGYGNPHADHIITADEDPNMDVVLNEINSQYRRL
ncbi:adhesion G-protein coupled receptor G2 isoform X2 [Boleophthalmus pectinirostris]|uniref:adhesion G-protein coupled receptor G2 isoform X2 n=1 Tax=Boleophthalmus pectinirostris TaxID=150288 RepID=UPI00242F2784|nr:adhesion G-protein coupled receptor G2 isoform X2 [Boleophthalmus pectinirostris]